MSDPTPEDASPTAGTDDATTQSGATQSDATRSSAARSNATDSAESRNPAVRRLADWDADRLGTLADRYGTPLYVIDRDRVRENCARLRDALPDADVRYAVKAHTGQAVLRTVERAGLAAECASAGELERALAAGFPGDRLHYTAVNPPARDLDRVVDRWREHPEITITAGAVDTLDRLAERGFDGRVCLRVTPGVGAGHHEKVRTGAHAKFGVPYDRAASVVREATDRFEVVGIHAHAGSGIDAAGLDRHRELVSRMGALARRLVAPESEGVEDAGADPVALEYVDVGGGFGVPYRDEEPPLDLSAVAAATREAFETALGDAGASTAGDARNDHDLDLVVEPGRYVVADAGVLLTRVNTVKPAPETTVVGVDAGMTDLLRPAMYDAFHPIRNCSAETGAATETDGEVERDDRETVPVTVAGPICETADVFCEDRPLPAPKRGDLLAIGIAGAYGYEMASQYNSRPRPAEVAIGAEKDASAGTDTGSDATDSGPTLVRDRETIADVTAVERRAGYEGLAALEDPARSARGTNATEDDR
ncbi:diaminopimelate decarboxylase [Halopenitus persicus]|uniref:Diaminopimelate decarboxylase n=1 Tax=Halopenitus persicus TaxID=1048396 RepID=A0A1H3J2Z6_9EURY|nr:diaminopimelate decarboxylase [Halopenitus persicus]SDY33798.1 diaminopimelate decarboxylase [Halopenitus persicus]